MLDSIRQHIEEKIAGATLECSPFPHIIIENFFPDAIFERILELNPFKNNRGIEWLPKSNTKDVSAKTPYYARKQINFHRDDKFNAAPETQAFWDELKAMFLQDRWFERIIMTKYPEYFRLRFGDILDDADFFDLFQRQLFLQRHEPGYNIGPHTDIPTRVFTCIFSFAAHDGFDRYGTQLLRHNDRLVRCSGNDHYTPEGFVIVKVAPYKPNNFLLFFKTRQSFHSVAAIDDTVPNQRYGMQFQLYEPKGGLFKDLSANRAAFERKSKAPLSSKILALVGR